MKVQNRVANHHNLPIVAIEGPVVSMANDCCHLMMNEYWMLNAKSVERMVRSSIDDVLDEDDAMLDNTNVD